MGHTRGGKHANALELEVRALEVVEQPRASSEEHRHDVQLHLVDEPRSEELLGDVRATRQTDVLAAGSLFGLRERRLDADSMPSVTKVKVVPPSLTSGSRSWWVMTKTGMWNGGSSPHQPSHGFASHDPSPPNMFLPITVAPRFACVSSITSLDRLTSPPSRPWGLRHASSGSAHSWSCSPPMPSGFSSLGSGPAT